MLAQPPDFAIYIYSSDAFALLKKIMCKILDKILHKWQVTVQIFSVRLPWYFAP